MITKLRPSAPETFDGYQATETALGKSLTAEEHLAQLRIDQRIESGEMTAGMKVERLREIVAPEMNEASLLEAASIYRSFVIQSIEDADFKLGRNGDAVDTLRRASGYGPIRRMGIIRGEGKSYGLYNKDLNTVLIHENRLTSTYEEGDEYLRPEDVSVVRLAATLDHEIGHTFITGLDRYASRKHHAKIDVVSNNLRHHPEAAVTGNLKTDYRIRQEELAEGFGVSGRRALLEALGYDLKTIESYLAVRARRPEFGHMKDHNQIDTLDQVDAETGPHELLHKKAPESQRGNPGYLGYARFSSEEGLLDFLEETNNLHPAPKYDAQSWFEKVRTSQSKDAIDYVKTLKQGRREVLKKVGPRARLAKAVGAALLTVSVFGIGMGGAAAFDSITSTSKETTPPVQPDDPKDAQTIEEYKNHGYGIEPGVPAKPGQPHFEMAEDPAGRPIVIYHK